MSSVEVPGELYDTLAAPKLSLDDVSSVHFPPALQIRSDGVSVWVNDRQQCLARFGRYGAEVYVMNDGVMKRAWYRPGQPAWKTWANWVSAVFFFYRIRIDGAHMPQRWKSVQMLDYRKMINEAGKSPDDGS